MNGSGSAPITIDPGWPQGVQQTTLPGGGFRYTPSVREEYCVKEGDCCRYFGRASTGEPRSIPRPSADATNPTESTVLILATGMEASIICIPTAANMASVADTSQPTSITSACRQLQF